VVNLSYDLMGLVLCVYERESNMARFCFKLRKDGVAECFSSDACAIGYKKYGAVGHGGACGCGFYNRRNLAHFMRGGF